MAIERFELEIAYGEGDVVMPEGAKILSVGVRTLGKISRAWAWAIVDPTARHKVRRIATLPTGEDVDLPVNAAFVGTYYASKWNFTGHVFDLGEA